MDLKIRAKIMKKLIFFQIASYVDSRLVILFFCNEVQHPLFPILFPVIPKIVAFVLFVINF